MRIVFFPAAVDFHRWLDANGQNEAELHVGFHKKSSEKLSITYAEALDEALCFGWIDGVRNRIDADSYRIRFTPRKPKSQWSAVNIGHVERLIQAGRMRSEGLKAFAGATKQPRKYSYEQRHQAALPAADELRFRANGKAWAFFESRPPSYRRTCTFWVMCAKKEETRQRRLATLIANCAHSQLVKPLRRPDARKRAVSKRKKNPQ